MTRPLSIFAFKFNLRRYTLVIVGEGEDDEDGLLSAATVGAAAPLGPLVGRCRLTVSNLVLKAPTLSALEAIIRWNSFKFCLQTQLAPLNLGHRRAAEGGAVEGSTRARAARRRRRHRLLRRLRVSRPRRAQGRGLHSSTSHLNLSRFGHRIHPKHP